MNALYTNTDTSSDEEHTNSPYGHSDRRNSDFGSNWAREDRLERDISSNWRSAAPERLEANLTAWRRRTRFPIPKTISDEPTTYSLEDRSLGGSETDLLSRGSLDVNLFPRPSIDVSKSALPQRNDHRQQLRTHSLAELAPGTVIQALHLSEALTPWNAALPDWHAPQQSFKIPFDNNRAINFKIRFFVVTKVLEGIYQAVPIFTKDGKGIANVPEHEHNNYMSIRDHRSTDFECQNDALPVLETEEMDPGTVLLHPRALAMFNGPSTMWSRHQIAVHGRLTSYSTAVLLQYCYRRYGDEAVEEPSAKMINDLELGLQLAKVEQQKFNDAVAANPNHGRESRNGNKQRTPSPPTKQHPWRAGTRCSDSSDGLVHPQLQHFRYTAMTDASPSPTTSTNSFSTLSIDEEDDGEKRKCSNIEGGDL